MDTTIAVGVVAGLVAFATPWVAWAYVVHVRASTAVFGEEKK